MCHMSACGDVGVSYINVWGGCGVVSAYEEVRDCQSVAGAAVIVSCELLVCGVGT